jgi:hypothetical protein
MAMPRAFAAALVGPTICCGRAPFVVSLQTLPRTPCCSWCHATSGRSRVLDAIFNRFKRTQSIECTRGGRKCGKKSRPRRGKSPDAPQMSRLCCGSWCRRGQVHPHLVSCAGGLSQTLAVLCWGDVVLPRWQYLCVLPSFRPCLLQSFGAKRKRNLFLCSIRAHLPFGHSTSSNANEQTRDPQPRKASPW